MSSARNPVHPEKPTKEEAVKVLREHMDDARAEVLAQRYLKAGDKADGPDIPALKQRFLQQKPKR